MTKMDDYWIFSRLPMTSMPSLKKAWMSPQCQAIFSFLDSNTTFLSKHHGFLVEFEALIWGESGDMRQHPLICIKFTRSALNENPHLHGSIFPPGQVLQPWPLQCQLKDEVDLLATKSKSYFSFYRNPPSFGSPNSFRINPIGFFRRPMPNILVFIRLFNQIVNWVCRISYPLSSWSQR